MFLHAELVYFSFHLVLLRRVQHLSIVVAPLTQSLLLRQSCLPLLTDLSHVSFAVKYRKVPKFSDNIRLYCKHSTIQTQRVCHGVKPWKVANRITNSEDPDQTAPLGLHEVQKSYCSHPGRTRSRSRSSLLKFSRSLYLDNQLSESIHSWTIGTL